MDAVVPAGYAGRCMEPTDVTIQILQKIQEGIAGTNVRFEALQSDVNKRLDAVNDRLDAVNDRLETLDDRLIAVENAVVHLVERADATNVAIGMLTEQVKFSGRAATVASEARSRQD